jgi:hypothetical protein
VFELRVETSMQITSSAHHSHNFVLVQGPRWGDAEFLGRWLLAAAEAERFWREAYDDPTFHRQVESVCICYIPDFGISASIMVMHLKEYRATFVLDLNSEDGEDFVMMVAMGFFLPTAEGYQMTLPAGLTATTVRAAVLKYAKTEDEDFMLHPEHIVTTMPFAEARAWQDRLRAIDEFHSRVKSLGTA